MNEFLETTNSSTCDCIVKNTFEAVSSCLVCGESVLVSNYRSHVVICEKCKKAVLYMRAQLEDIKWN